MPAIRSRPSPFADIMLPLLGSGVTWLSRRGRTGHCLAHPRPGRRARLRPLEPEADVSPGSTRSDSIRQALGGAIPLIGFSGAPFTLASYLIEGKPSRGSRTPSDDVRRTGPLARADATARRARHRLPRSTGETWGRRAALFDSSRWCSAPDDYAQYWPPTRAASSRPSRRPGCR